MNRVIITIGRQFGSGGHEIGEKLSKVLEIPFYDKELIETAAKESGMHTEVVRNIDETASNSLLYSLSTGAFIMGGRYSPLSDAPINDKLFFAQSDMIRRFATEGSCIIVGRCADYVLRERKDVFHVFIHAPKEDRIKRIMKLHNLSESKAKDRIKSVDKKRAVYYNYYSDHKWGDLQCYDLSINSSYLGVDQTVDVLAAAAKVKMGK